MVEAKSFIRMKAEEDPYYCPYCARCDGLYRMPKIEPFLWKHLRCGAVHDERTEAEKRKQ